MIEKLLERGLDRDLIVENLDKKNSISAGFLFYLY